MSRLFAVLALLWSLGCSQPSPSREDVDPSSGDGDGDGNGDGDSDTDGSADGEDDTDDGEDGEDGADAGPVDPHAPSVPEGLRLVSEDPCTQARFTWDVASADPEGAALRGYQLYVDGVHRFTTLTTEQIIQLVS